MNTYFALAAAVTALVSYADAAACSSTQQQSAYLGMIGLLTGSSLSDCASDSGYNMLYATALPTDTERVAMCGVQACHDLIVAVLATNPPDCDLTIPTSGAVMNVYQLASTFESECDVLTATTAPPTEAPTSAPTDAPTTAPTDAPTSAPTDAPTTAPTVSPTTEPTDAPTSAPTNAPTTAPTISPTTEPTEAPTDAPSTAPTDAPTSAPTDAPTTAPTVSPTTEPTEAPTDAPSTAPTVAPTSEPIAPGGACY